MTRWKKIYRDLWNNRARTILVILSITVGVFAIGLISATRQALVQSLNAQYFAIQPADVILKSEPGLSQDFVSSIRNMRGVREAEGRRSLALRISLDGKGETWRDLTLYSVDDYNDQRLFIVHQQDGTWPPEKGQVLLERASMDYIGVQPGDQILVKTPDGRKFNLQVAGRAHDLYRIPPIIEGWIYGYVSKDTVRWMGESDKFNELYLSAQDSTHILTIADKATNRIESQGLPVYQKTIPTADEHPLGFIIQTLLILLGLVAMMGMVLSALFVINIISALIAQQERQIGIMKAVGAQSSQVVFLYYGMVLIIGGLACAIAIPISSLASNALTAFVAKLINFNPPVVELTWTTFLIQAGCGLLIPLCAATPTILSGTRILPARVLNEYGIHQTWGGAGFVTRLLKKMPALTRDSVLALQNPFRKKGRSILSLVTLTFAGAVFMAIVNLQGSLNSALNDMFAFWRYDAWLIIDRHQPIERLVDEAQSVSGVRSAHGWGFTIARYVRPDGTESDNLYLIAPPAGTPLLDPPIIAGRSLQPGDRDAVLVSPGFLSAEPGLRLGSPIKIKIEGREQTYTIVGVMNMMGNATIGYFTLMDYQAYTRHVREPNRANTAILTLNADSTAEQQAVVSAVETRFDSANINVLSSFLINEEREEINAAFDIIVALLMVMTVLLSTVGGLGLMGTMGLNVLERTREIGVMRAFGASNFAVFRIVLIEGLVIGAISWFFAIGLSIPFSVLLSTTIGQTFMNYPLPMAITSAGILAWAGLVLFISIIASLLPAWNAVRLTVTEVLAYE